MMKANGGQDDFLSHLEQVNAHNAREEYLYNLHQIKERSEFHPDPDARLEEQIAYIQSEARELNRLQNRNNELLSELFFHKDPEYLSDDEAKEWFHFARRLVDDYKQADLGLAYQLHTRLLRRGRACGRWDEIIRELYYCGLTLHYLNSLASQAEQNVYFKEIREYFEEGASFLPYFADLDSESRAYILRCLGNIHLGYPSFVSKLLGKITNDYHKDQVACYERAYKVMTDPELRAVDPSLPWDDYLYAMHFSKTTMLSLLRDGVGDEEFREMIYESACFVYNRQEQAAKRQQLALSARTIYVYAAARYHTGRISAEELVDILLDEYERDVENESMSNQIYRKLSLVTYLRYYVTKCSPENQAAIMARVADAEEKSFAFVRTIPFTDYFSQAVLYMRNSVAVTLTTGGVENHKKRLSLLRWFLACHRPTYVHSLMVAWLTQMMLKRLLEVKPEIVDDEVAGDWRGTTNKDELVMRAVEAALYHDVGKISLLDIVSNYGRRLTDEEFRLIQNHPAIGGHMLGGIKGMELCADAAHNHHRFYNELGGYPKTPGRRAVCHCNLVVDIITIADSLDAGSDNVGRSYANGKTVEMLVEEFKRDRDTRYAGYVVDIFDDADYVKKLSDGIFEKRRSIYRFVYCGDPQRSEEAIKEGVSKMETP